MGCAARVLPGYASRFRSLATPRQASCLLHLRFTSFYARLPILACLSVEKRRKSVIYAFLRSLEHRGFEPLTCCVRCNRSTN